MKTQNWILNVKTAVLIGLTLITFAANAGTSHLIKTEREDFGALIQEGLDAQKKLRQELRQNAGMTKTEREWDKDIKESGRVAVGVVGAEQRVSPTTNYVRQKPSRHEAPDLNQQRIADEFDSLEN